VKRKTFLQNTSFRLLGCKGSIILYSNSINTNPVFSSSTKPVIWWL